jgi:hypothetical protein
MKMTVLGIDLTHTSHFPLRALQALLCPWDIPVSSGLVTC